MKSRRQYIWFLLIILSLLTGPATFAATVTWDGSTDSSWNTASNWDTNTVPVALDDVVIISSGTAPILDIPSTTINSLSITSGSLDLGSGTGNTLNVTSNFSLENTGRLIMDGASDILDVDGNFTTSAASGALQDFSAGTLNVAGNFTQSDGGWGSYEFPASGSHKLVLDGSSAQTVSFANPSITDGRFQDLEINKTGGTVVFTSNVVLIGNVTNTAGLLNINSGTTFIVSGTSFNNTAGGTILGEGTLNVTNTTFSNAGSVDPGASPGILTVTGDYPQTSSGALNIEIGGTTVGTDYDQLIISGSGTATLAGDLNVSLINGFVPALGNTFQILTYASQSGAFTVNHPITGGFGWDITYGASAATLEVVVGAYDTDGDGLTDYDEINFHGTDPLNSDSDGDGLTDSDEINIHGTDPLNPDTDGDGVHDGFEVNATTDPLDPLSKPDVLLWSKTYGGGASLEYSWAIDQTNDGGFIVAGQTNATGSWDFYVMKLNSDSTVAWQKTYGGALNEYSYSIKQTDDGGYIVSGYIDASTLGRSDDVWALKLKPDSEPGGPGQIEWERYYGGLSSNKGFSILQTSDDFYVIGGASGSRAGDTLVMKIDAQGNVPTSSQDIIDNLYPGAFQKSFGLNLFYDHTDNSTYVHSKDNAYWTEETSDGGFIAAGYSNSFRDPILGRTDNDIYVVKVKTGAIANGNASEWNRTYGGPNEDVANAVKEYPSGGYIVAGYTVTAAGDRDALLMKLTSNGDIEWQKTYGGVGEDWASSVDITPNGNFIVGAYTESFGMGNGDAWILELDQNGNVVWQKAYGGVNYDNAGHIQQLPDGGFVMVGARGVSSEEDIWILKTDANGNIGNQCDQVSITNTTPAVSSLAPTFTSNPFEDFDQNIGGGGATSTASVSDSSLTGGTQCTNDADGDGIIDINDTISIPDAALKAAIETELGITDPTPIDMLGLTVLDASSSGITDLTGLEHAVNLTDLRLGSNNIIDISALTNLTNLVRLYLSNNNISDITPVGGLTSLTDLRLRFNLISSINAVSGLTNLTSLFLDNNQISDISSLAGLTSLINLHLYINQISDISPVGGLSSLMDLRLNSNQISDFSAVSVPGLTSLTTLHLHNNIISSIPDLSGLTNLTTLHLEKNQISDITAVSGLISLTYLNLAENADISDITAVAGMSELRELWLHTNHLISDISHVAGLTNLELLQLDNNNISDISHVSGLTNLWGLYLGANNVNDASLSQLAGLATNLTNLNLYGNGISDISDLAILVNLTNLAVHNNNISNISVLSLMPNLTDLYLYGNQISDISVLAGLANLSLLHLHTNQIGDISALSTLTNLTILSLTSNLLNGEAYCIIIPLITVNNPGITFTYDPDPGTDCNDWDGDGLSNAVETNTGTFVDANNTGTDPNNADSDGDGLTDGEEVNTFGTDPNVVNTFAIPDAALKAAIEAELGVVDPTPTDMLGLSTLTANSVGIVDLTGLEYAVNMTYLDLYDNQIIDISAVAGLTNLTHLQLSSNQISDISSVAALTNLTFLQAAFNQIIDISAVTGLTELTNLHLGENQIIDISAVAGLTKLTQLNLNTNQISDISAITNLTDLTLLVLHNNQIIDIAALSGLTNLTDLRLYYNQIIDISTLSTLTNLTILHLLGNQIIDISVVAGLTNLTFLDLAFNQISNISAVASLSNLTVLHVGFQSGNPLDNNKKISDISAVSGLTNLTVLSLYNNQISDITPITGMTNLTDLLLTGNVLNGEAYCVTIALITVNNPGITFTYDPDPGTDCNDWDGDGLSNAVETNTGTFVDTNDTGTDPNNPDTDGDGLSDGIEVGDGTNPLVASSVPLTVNPISAPADTTTGFEFQTQADAPGAAVQLRVFNDFNNNGIADVGEWPIISMVMADNGQGWINEVLTPDSDPSSPGITTIFGPDDCGYTNYFPVGNYICLVKNALGETGSVQFSITDVSAPQTVTGFVYEDGTFIPVPNAFVEYESTDLETITFTDINGAYTLQVPTTGSGEICVNRDGYGDSCQGLAVTVAGVSNLDLFLIPAVTQITGIVTESGSGNPIWGAEVWAETQGTSEMETLTYTNIDGSYTLPVIPGRIFIGAGKYGYMEPESSLTVPPGGISGHTISLIPATTQIEGIVTESGTGIPICGAEVWIDTNEGESWNETGTDGSFILPVTSGERTICVEQDGYMTSCNTLIVPPGGISNFSAYLIPMDSQITGTVTEYGTGNPIPGIYVYANTSDFETWIETISDNNGNFTLPVLSGIEWNVNTFGSDGYIAEGNVTLIPTVPGPNIADFILHPETAWIDGTLLDEYGSKAVEGAFFWFSRLNPTPSLWNFGITDSAGHVTVGAEAGDWMEGVSPENTPELLVDGLPREMVRQDEQFISNITTGEHRAVTSYMYYADVAIEGRVYYSDGVTPVPNARINAYTLDALNGPSQTSVGLLSEGVNADANGYYRIPLLGGTWDLDVNSGAATDTRTLTTNDGNDIIDQPGETLTGVDFILNYNNTCDYFIAPVNWSYDSSGGTGNVGITTSIGCNWTAVSNDGWITITSGSSGSGFGTIDYTVAPNSGPERIGTITITGNTFTVTQAIGDSDRDGISDEEEINTYNTDHLNQDSDGDGLLDGEEIIIGSDPLNLHSDTDGFSDFVEVINSTDPNNDLDVPSSLTVNSNADVIDSTPGDGVCETATGNGICTLRAAIDESNVSGPYHVFVPTDTYNLSNGGLSISSNISIEGDGHTLTIIDADPDGTGPGIATDRVFNISVSGISVGIGDVTIRNGDNVVNGGGIYNNASTVVVKNSKIANNITDGVISSFGGGIYNDSGTLSIINSTISGNASLSASGEGGGIYNNSTGTLTIANSTISNNAAVDGGGILNEYDSTCTITSSAIFNNTASDYGGGMYNNGTTGNTSAVTIINSTISGNNTTNYSGGGIYNYAGTLSITHSTISDNTAQLNGGGIYHQSFGLLELTSNIIAGNNDTTGNDSPDLYSLSNHTSYGNNLIGDTTGTSLTLITGDLAGDQISGILDPNLEPFIDPGPSGRGRHTLISGSPAIDTGDNTSTTVVSGTIIGWSLDWGFDPFRFDDYVGVASNIEARWSLATLIPPALAFFYPWNCCPGTHAAHVTGVTDIYEITDASMYTYSDWAVGAAKQGEFILFYNEITGYYGAFRVDDVYDDGTGNAVVDVTWYLQEDGSPNFGTSRTEDQLGFLRPTDGNGDSIVTCDIGAIEFYPIVNGSIVSNSIQNPDYSTIDPPPGFAGVYSVELVLTNGPDDIPNPFFEVFIMEFSSGALPNSIKLLNADGGLSGVGATLTPTSVQLGGDNILNADDTLTVLFEIALPLRDTFRFWVNLKGTP